MEEGDDQQASAPGSQGELDTGNEGDGEVQEGEQQEQEQAAAGAGRNDAHNALRTSRQMASDPF